MFSLGLVESQRIARLCMYVCRDISTFSSLRVFLLAQIMHMDHNAKGHMDDMYKLHVFFVLTQQ